MKEIIAFAVLALLTISAGVLAFAGSASPAAAARDAAAQPPAYAAGPSTT